ncbi:recombinase family protein [Youngiibacter fragilis]|uniref:recombinase family protein n=1 Tax=Youngiibacter fragilis TaxID=1408819 RepID=UPI00241EF86F|nr:recombinase family protein [Youngiibacter fragilis]
MNEDQAKVVRRIYQDYLNGKGPNRIAKDLEREGVINWNGKTKWYESTVRKILSNEKYKGDALLQKTYTIDYLSKKRAENNGEVPMYYVEDSHPGIIEKDMWEAVQLEMERRRAFAEKHGITRLDYSNDSNPFSGKVICGECGGLFGRKVWNSTNKKLRRVIWQCNHKYEEKGKVLCKNRHVDEELLKDAVVRAFEHIRYNPETYLRKWEKDLKSESPLIRHQAKYLLEVVYKSKNAEGNQIYYELVECIKLNIYTIIVTLIDETDIRID